MILLTVNFGFHVFAVFLFYKRLSLAYGRTLNNFVFEIDAMTWVISILWHFYYASISFLVILSGALLSKHVRRWINKLSTVLH